MEQEEDGSSLKLNSVWFYHHLFQADELTASTGGHPVTEVTKVTDNGPESPVIAHASFNLMFE